MNVATYAYIKWDLISVSCCLAIMCLTWLKQNAKDFLHRFFKMEKYMQAYEGAMFPFQGQKHWLKKDMSLDPTKVKVKPGRLRRNRRRDTHEDP